MSVCVHGDVEDGFGPVVDAFRAIFDERNEVGAACAVVVDGQPVLDLWGGHRDKPRTRPWERDTMVTVFSTTKGILRDGDGGRAQSWAVRARLPSCHSA